MMIKFSWKKINNKFGWNAHDVLQYFYIKQNIKIPPFLNRKIPKRVKIETSKSYPLGPCFILNIDEVLENTEYPNDLYIYLELASMRNRFDYSIRGQTTLPLLFVPEYLTEIIHINRLLTIKDEKVYFKYEQEK